MLGNISQDNLHLHFIGCCGSLFRIAEVRAREPTPSDGRGHTTTLLWYFPQFAKRPTKEAGVFTLAVNEVALLRSTSAPRILWSGDDVLDEYIHGRRRCLEVDALCKAYCFLTTGRGYWLKHGGAFGVHYLVYTSHPDHGHSEFLAVVSLKPMNNLERRVLLRLARSVRKRAMVLTPMNNTFDVEFLVTEV
jgi:hypothetical protein